MGLDTERWPDFDLLLVACAFDRYSPPASLCVLSLFIAEVSQYSSMIARHDEEDSHARSIFQMIK